MARRTRGNRLVQTALGTCLLIGMVASTAAAQNAGTGKQSSSWRQIRTGNFQVAGDASSEQLERVLGELNAFRAALTTMFPDSRQTSPVPTWVVVLRDQSAFERFQPRDSRGRRMGNVGGYFTRTADANFLVLPAPRTDDELRIVFHEYSHYFVARNVRGHVPTWLNEGLADFYSTFKRQFQGGVMVGAPPTTARILAQETFVPLRNIVSPRDMENRWRWPNQIAVFYAESWALVHYILVERQNPTAMPITAYLRALNGNASQDEAFKQAFGTDIDGMDRELRAYVRRVSLHALTLDLHLDAARERATPMLESDVKTIEGRLLHQTGAEREAERELMSALALDPAHTAARVALAQLRLTQDRDDDAIGILRQVREDAPTNGAAAYYLGVALEKTWQHEAALDAFTRAVELNAGNPYPWLGLMQSCLALRRDLQAGAALSNALGLEWTADFYYRQSINALRIGRNDIAAAAMRKYVDLGGRAEGASSPYPLFVWAIASWRMERPGDADAALTIAEQLASSGEWASTVVQFLQDRLPADRFLAKADNPMQRTEAHAYMGFKLDVAGRHDEAVAHFKWVVDQGVRDALEYELARNEIARAGRATVGTLN